MSLVSIDGKLCGEIRSAFIGDRSLIDVVRQLATQVEPWSPSAFCNTSDFVAGGGQADSICIPIAKPLTAVDRPGSREHIHKVYLQPDPCVPLGEVIAFWPALGRQAIVKMSREELSALYPPR